MSKRNKKKTIIQPDPIRRDDRCLAILFIILIGVVTFLIRVRMINYTSPRIVGPILDTGWHTDLFSYHKLIMVIVAAAAAMIILSHKILVERYTIRASYLNLPLLLLVVLVLLSTLTADHKSLTLMGLYNQGTGSLLLVANLALCLAAANTVFKPWFNRGITVVLLGITVVNALILFTYFRGIDILEFQFMKNLIAPPELQKYLAGNFRTTLANTNYISGWGAAVCAYFTAGLLLKNGWRQRCFYMLAAVVAFAIILAALSSSGFVTLLIITPLLVAAAFLSRERRQALLAGGITLLLCAGVFMGMNAYDPRVADETLGIMKQGVETSYEQLPEQIPSLANLLPARPLTACAATATIPPEDNFDLPEPGWAAGTGRAYIWGETWRLIQARPLLGYGQGTLAYYFPQNDINMIAAMNSYNMLVTKPHNMYVDIAYGSGIPALLALLVLFGLHFYHTGRRLWKAERSEALFFPTALFLFFCACVVQWLFNDLIIDVGAIFWILLGVGISLNTVHEPQKTSDQ